MRTSVRPFLLLVLLPVLHSICPSPAAAELAGVEWVSTETIDSPVTSTPSTAAPWIAYWRGHWRAVYEKSGQIWMATRGNDLADWSERVLITDPAIPSRNPHLGVWEYQHTLFVVWEDDRLGHSEVWVRRYDGSQWSTEECITGDGVASRSSSIACSGFEVYVAWEDSSAGSFRVRGREFTSSWGSVEEIARVPGTGREPSISCDQTWFYQAVWTDTRTGTPQIMRRKRYLQGPWDAEVRLTAGRHPSVSAVECCGDIGGMEYFFVAFERQGARGADESWGLCYRFDYMEISPISPDDGIPSVRPQASGQTFDAFVCTNQGGPDPRYYASFSDALAPESVRNTIAGTCTTPEGTEALAPALSAGCGVGFRDSNPNAEIAAASIQEVDGVPALRAQIGHLPGCTRVRVNIPPALVIGPEGNPSTVVEVRELCSTEPGGAPAADQTVRIDFGGALENAIHWDPLQVHDPWVTAMSDSGGDAVFSIRGGGCSTAGNAWVTCTGVDGGQPEWAGVKSPDVNGDCVVRPDDLRYVQRALGTSTFCADLDGSGLVDEADVAIVEAAMWDHCSDVTGLADGDPRRGGVLTLAAAPNPARDRTVLRLDGEFAGPCAVRIYDAGGRIVRSLKSAGTGFGLSTSFAWDLRDEAGHRVGAGIYFARAHSLKRGVDGAAPGEGPATAIVVLR
jgi:hypothetical protein